MNAISDTSKPLNQTARTDDELSVMLYTVARLSKETQKLVNIREYAADKPGLTCQLDYAQVGHKTSNDVLTVVKMAEGMGIDISDSNLHKVDTYLYIIAVVQYQHIVEPDLRSGYHLYPRDMIPCFYNCLKYLALL